MIRLSVPEIEGGPLSVTEEKEKKKDWSWSILVVGYASKGKRDIGQTVAATTLQAAKYFSLERFCTSPKNI